MTRRDHTYSPTPPVPSRPTSALSRRLRQPVVPRIPACAPLRLTQPPRRIGGAGRSGFAGPPPTPTPTPTPTPRESNYPRYPQSQCVLPYPGEAAAWGLQPTTLPYPGEAAAWGLQPTTQGNNPAHFPVAGWPGAPPVGAQMQMQMQMQMQRQMGVPPQENFFGSAGPYSGVGVATGLQPAPHPGHRTPQPAAVSSTQNSGQPLAPNSQFASGTGNRIDWSREAV
jgi:hypothetical protein